jgi:hypothetical protein
LDIDLLTLTEIDDYISQIKYVAPLFRIRYYLRDIKNALYSMFSEEGSYIPDPEYDEDETAETRAEDEKRALKHKCEDVGLIGPEN